MIILCMSVMNPTSRLNTKKPSTNESTCTNVVMLEFYNCRKQNVHRFKKAASIQPRNNPHSNASVIFFKYIWIFPSGIIGVLINVSCFLSASSTEIPCYFESNRASFIYCTSVAVSFFVGSIFITGSDFVVIVFVPDAAAAAAAEAGTPIIIFFEPAVDELEELTCVAIDAFASVEVAVLGFKSILRIRGIYFIMKYPTPKPANTRIF